MRGILIFSWLQSAEYPVAIQPNAKGMFPEGHARFIGERRVYELDLLSIQSNVLMAGGPPSAGTYWGQVSSAYCSEVVEASDAYLFAGKLPAT